MYNLYVILCIFHIYLRMYFSIETDKINNKILTFKAYCYKDI